MTIGENLKAVIERYVRREIGLPDLRAWRRAHIDHLVAADDATQELHDALALVLAEYLRGQRDEEGVRAGLRMELLRHSVQATIASLQRASMTVTATTSIDATPEKRTHRKTIRASHSTTGKAGASAESIHVESPTALAA